jgi:hypothetical protein
MGRSAEAWGEQADQAERDLEAAAWHQHELETQELEEAQATLTADPFYVKWLEILNAEEKA